MTDIITAIDNEYRGYRYTGTFDDLLKRYKKRKSRVRKACISTSAVCLAAILLIFSGNSALFTGKRPNLSITAFALDNAKTAVKSAKTKVKNSQGVKITKEYVIYSSESKEEILGATCPTGEIARKRLVLVPSPIRFKIKGGDIQSISMECSDDSTLYNKSSDNLNMTAIYAKKLDVNWIPNCDRLSRDMKANIYMSPSTLENDKLADSEIKRLVKSASDYTKYFGATVRFGITFNDNRTETVKIRITLDKNGQYYVERI